MWESDNSESHGVKYWREAPTSEEQAKAQEEEEMEEKARNRD